MIDKPELLIVPAGPGDAAELALLHASAFPEPWSESAIGRLIGADAGVALVASSGPCEPPAGFVIAFAVADEAEILTIAVRLELRRQGIARKLIEALIEDVAARGVEQIHLEAGARNAAALALYRSLGFELKGRRASYYWHAGEPPEDAVLMAKLV